MVELKVELHDHQNNFLSQNFQIKSPIIVRSAKLWYPLGYSIIVSPIDLNKKSGFYETK